MECVRETDYVCVYACKSVNACESDARHHLGSLVGKLGMLKNLMVGERESILVS